MLPSALLSHLSKITSTTLQWAGSVSGGDINEACQLKSQSGTYYFLKYNLAPQAYEMFKSEAKGLELLQKCGANCPEVLAYGLVDQFAYLLLEMIQPGNPSPEFWESFGHSLAQIHQSTNTHFGLAYNNFIGTLHQNNEAGNTWQEFYFSQRIAPQIRLAIQNGLLHQGDFDQAILLSEKLPNICPEEPPALIHGDLWSGNFICSSNQASYLIDPAVCYSHREMDIAMTRLFGGFAPRFYSAYQESWPLTPGIEERLGIYQLYYILVHVNLFGGGYVGQARNLLGKYLV